MEKRSLNSLEKYEKFCGIAGAEREVRELKNGNYQVTYKQRYGKNSLTFEERKKALKNKLTKKQKARKSK